MEAEDLRELSGREDGEAAQDELEGQGDEGGDSDDFGKQEDEWRVIRGKQSFS